MAEVEVRWVAKTEKERKSIVEVCIEVPAIVGAVVIVVVEADKEKNRTERIEAELALEVCKRMAEAEEIRFLEVEEERKHSTREAAYSRGQDCWPTCSLIEVKPE